jgi:hypothetical protein
MGTVVIARDSGRAGAAPDLSEEQQQLIKHRSFHFQIKISTIVCVFGVHFNMEDFC